jgi:acyl dehydratase
MPFGEPVEVTQDMINRFAELSGDHQWIHVDVERAKRESPFGTTIAHAYLVLALLAPIKEDDPIRPKGIALNMGFDKLQFLSPVASGSKAHIRRRILDVADKRNGILLKYEAEIWVVGADRPAIEYRRTVMYVPLLD